MSAFGPKRTCGVALQMSAIGGKADIFQVDASFANVCPKHGWELFRVLRDFPWKQVAL